MEYQYVIQDAYTLDLIDPIPFTPTDRYWRLLSACGSFAGWVPLDHFTSTRANYKDRALNLVVYRDDAVDWWGRIVNAQPDEQDDRKVTLDIREPTIWWQMRTIEEDKHYNADICSIVRKVWTEVTTKASMNADLGNISIGSGLAGVTRRVPIAGSGRPYMQDVVDWLVDNDTGLEYRCDFSTSTHNSPQCVIKVGVGLGSAKTQLVTEHVASHVGRELDWNPQRSATRTHAVGVGYTSTKQNTGSVTAGLPLMELVLDRSNTADHDLIDDAAREARRKSQPPVQPFDIEYTPHAYGLTINTFDPGDSVPLDTGATDLTTITGTRRRIVGVGVMPQTADGPESVALTLNLPADSLGA